MKRQLRRNTNLTRSQIESLLYGFTLIWDPTEGKPFASNEERREAWFKNREWLLSLEGVERVPGVFGCYPLKRGRKPAAYRDYERGKKSKRSAAGIRRQPETEDL